MKWTSFLILSIILTSFLLVVQPTHVAAQQKNKTTSKLSQKRVTQKSVIKVDAPDMMLSSKKPIQRGQRNNGTQKPVIKVDVPDMISSSKKQNTKKGKNNGNQPSSSRKSIKKTNNNNNQIVKKNTKPKSVITNDKHDL